MLQSNRRHVAIVSFALFMAIIICNGTYAGSGSAASEEAAEPRAVDLNSASVEQLTTVPGIGDATARRIVEWREEHGPFRRVEDLMKVKGIGEKSLEKLRPHVTVDPEK
jgi:competence protein ComEA